MTTKTRKALWWTLAGVFLALILITGPRAPREIDTAGGFLPGNPRRGGELFFDRGCGGCHAIAGVGGREAADLSRSRQAPSDLEDIAGAMWNHAPDMWESFNSAGIEPATLTPEDVADLMAFLFTAGYLEEMGNPGRGRAILTSRKCRTCHLLGEEGSQLGAELTGWSSRANPIIWATALWNHAPEMEEAMEEKGIEWPALREEEVVDILSYLRTIGNVPREGIPTPGDPMNGRQLFREHCSGCHRSEGQGQEVGPALDIGATSRSLAGLAAALWNHSPAMGESMRELRVERPTFTEKEMADLVTYLFAVRYFESPGDRDAGAAVYASRCSACHGEGAAGEEGPDLRGLGSRTTAIFMASTLWNHGPRMYEEAREQGLEWPRFEGHQMHDLVEYLRSLEP